MAGRFFLRFCLLFCCGTCHRRDTAEKKKAPKLHRHRSEKRSFEKSRWDDTAGKSSRERQAPAPVCRSQSGAPVIRGIAYPPIRHRADHRTPAEPSAAEFSGLVSATAAFTLDVYGHVTDQMKRESADRMERFIQSISAG